MRTTLCLLLPVCLSLSLSAGEKSPVQFEKQGDQVQITINGEKFATYNTSGDYKKPFMLPIHGPGGVILTRSLDSVANNDHPWQKGLYVAVDEINKIKYWGEKGLIVNKSAETQAGKDSGTLTVVNHWLGEDGQTPIMEEKTIITIYPDRMMTYDINFTAINGELEFEDTKEGLFAYRMAPSMREAETGKILTAEGVTTTKEAWGKPAAWIDYYGTVEGKVFGVAIFDHPKNFRPSRYHVRDYGLFSINPFGQKAYTQGKEEAQPHHLKQGESLRLRYGAYFHAGDTAEGNVKEKYQEFVQRAN